MINFISNNTNASIHHINRCELALVFVVYLVFAFIWWTKYTKKKNWWCFSVKLTTEMMGLHIFTIRFFRRQGFGKKSNACLFNMENSNRIKEWFCHAIHSQCSCACTMYIVVICVLSFSHHQAPHKTIYILENFNVTPLT